VCDTAPDQIRAQLRGLTTRRKVAVASRYRPGDPLTPAGGTKRALVTIARRWTSLDTEIRELDQAIKTILDAIAAPLLARHGVGYDTAGALLCTAGDNPDRLATEASFASLCGTAPVPISSGNTQRRRLNRAGDRNANSALWTIVMVRLRSRHAPTITYLDDASPKDTPNATRSAASNASSHARSTSTSSESLRTRQHSTSPLDTKRHISSGATPLRAGRSILDLIGLAQGIHCFLDGKEDCRFERAERTAATNHQRNRGHGHVVGSLP
jgi:hypothetical protein